MEWWNGCMCYFLVHVGNNYIRVVAEISIMGRRNSGMSGISSPEW